MRGKIHTFESRHGKRTGIDVWARAMVCIRTTAAGVSLHGYFHPRGKQACLGLPVGRLICSICVFLLLHQGTPL